MDGETCALGESSASAPAPTKADCRSWSILMSLKALLGFLSYILSWIWQLFWRLYVNHKRRVVLGDWTELEFSPEEVQRDREAVLSAVRQDWKALQFASEELQADREIVEEALRQDWHALRHVSKCLRADRTLMAAAVQKSNGWALEFAAEELYRDPGLLQEATSRLGGRLGLPLSPVAALVPVDATGRVILAPGMDASAIFGNARIQAEEPQNVQEETGALDESFDTSREEPSAEEPQEASAGEPCEPQEAPVSAKAQDDVQEAADSTESFGGELTINLPEPSNDDQEAPVGGTCRTVVEASPVDSQEPAETLIARLAPAGPLRVRPGDTTLELTNVDGKELPEKLTELDLLDTLHSDPFQVTRSDAAHAAREELAQNTERAEPRNNLPEELLAEETTASLDPD
ncbi:hypothetical protein AK812_SmicGene38936 [Symbiodinium microadriaticum]|uniref:DUF4116 domain-containing protein n=1 Tax=Symbiodinium microadriaticum TaxID=2951 RepID=A0A1Q9CCG9_SYMMI|nr:hypothetical protein AK812_SmicGene38936 [Symbiodinium microadriaticum]CAE7668365.1 unnamed protein product [Symbiodinium microadriaticum]CAE7939502.1 unnamed protein product [Symbiodinium sp. KB8]